MPDEQYEPTLEDTGYGSGRTKLIYDIGEEQFAEQTARTQDIETAERARTVEQERKSLWSLLGAGIGLAFGGPLPMLLGFAGGKALGGLGTYGGKAVEDYMVSEDVGKFGRGEQFELQDINRELEQADRADFWGDVMDIGKVAALQYTLGGGSFTDPGNYSPWHIGGKKAATEGMYGAGLFGNVQGEGSLTGFKQALKGKPEAGTLWGNWMGKDWTLPAVDVYASK